MSSVSEWFVVRGATYLAKVALYAMLLAHDLRRYTGQRVVVRNLRVLSNDTYLPTFGMKSDTTIEVL